MLTGEVPFTLNLPEARIFRNIDSPETLNMLNCKKLDKLETLTVYQDLLKDPLPELSEIPSSTFNNFEMKCERLNLELLI